MEDGLQILGLGQGWKTEIVASQARRVEESQAVMAAMGIMATMNHLPVKENLGCHLNRLHPLTNHEQAQRLEMVGLTKGGIEIIKVVSAVEWSRTRMFQTMDPGTIDRETGMGITMETYHRNPIDGTSGTMTRGGEAGVRISDMTDMPQREGFIADDLFVNEIEVTHCYNL